MSSWSCPHESNGVCLKVNELPCDPGMRGCVLYGRFVFSNPAKNRPAKPDARHIVEGKDDEPSLPPSRPKKEGRNADDLDNRARGLLAPDLAR